MEMKIGFPGNMRVTATFDSFSVVTDQPNAAGGDGEGPTPFQLFLASIGTCAGVYYLAFLRQRGIDPEGAGLTMTPTYDPKSGLPREVRLEVHLPVGFPEKYRDAVVRAIDVCKVKRSLSQPPTFVVSTGFGAEEVIQECALPVGE